MNDWREETLSRMRKLIEEADPEAVEERKWNKRSNPAGLFNSSLERRRSARPPARCYSGR